MTNCPLCGSKVVYLGFNSLECAKPTCENGVKLDFSWAGFLRDSIHKLNEKEILELDKGIKSGTITRTNFKAHPTVIKYLKIPVKYTP